ncbi:MAG TPA: adenosylmethionine--8-amino-7-oxononanoate transaminase [Gammaproteobacteria bacterium]|nr:adenosylmethionine--8-amino-7-oxononanoate transaminase [Gammaproteobacteria bacterium]
MQPGELSPGSEHHARAAALRARDLACLWHPCTQMKDHAGEVPLVPIARGEGPWLIGVDGSRYLDAISSWWVNLFGHANPRISRAVADQLTQLEQVMFAGFTHAPAVELAERLVALTPPGLVRCFYADNGSSGIEVALKMSFHYWQNAGRPGKKRFLALTHSYHGETLGALAVGGVDIYRATYAPLLMPVDFLPSPDASAAAPGMNAEQAAIAAAAALEARLAERAEEYAALIVEPLVQCAGGMRMHHPRYLQLAAAACRRHGVHLIADEIAVGFGRTGTLFACEQAGVTPDFLCLSKGLTGGYLPLAAVLTTDAVYQAFYDDWRAGRAFLHSHSYTGNPLACAAAVATLDIFAAEPVLERNRLLARHLAQRLAPLADHPHVSDVRQTGLIAAIDLVRDRETCTPYDWRERRGLGVYRHALARGVLLRPLGTVVYFMPPYVVSEDDIDLMVAVAHEGIDLATAD